MEPTKVIIKPLVTEKSTWHTETQNQYVFQVDHFLDVFILLSEDGHPGFLQFDPGVLHLKQRTPALLVGQGRLPEALLRQVSCQLQGP